MSEGTTTSPQAPARETEGVHDLSLLLGGPFFQLLLRSGLIRPTFDLLLRRVLVLTLLPWAPLLLLTLASGAALGSSLRVPFLWDIDVHVRFLVVLPLLVLAERMVHERLRPLFLQFLERDLVTPADVAAFDVALARARRWRDSYVAEALMLVVSFGMTAFFWRAGIALDAPTWYGRPGSDGMEFTPAGYWYGYASLPVFRFLILRWLYRLVVFYPLLARIARLPLRIVPTHPDGAGGLGFLGTMGSTLQPFYTAVTATLAGFVAGKILHEGRTLPEYYVLIGAVLAVLLVSMVVPLLLFAPRLAAVRREGLREYGALAQHYVAGFHRKWIDGGAPEGEALLGTADIQSLADLSVAYERVLTMRTVPLGLRPTVQFLGACAAPLLPLLLTMFPLETLLKEVVDFVL